MTILFEYRRALAADRGTLPGKWIAALSQTGKFARNRRSQLLYVINNDPWDWVQIGRKEEFYSILDDLQQTGVLKITGDIPDQDDLQGLWYWLHDRRYKLPKVDRRIDELMSTVCA